MRGDPQVSLCSDVVVETLGCQEVLRSLGYICKCLSAVAETVLLGMAKI